MASLAETVVANIQVRAHAAQLEAQPGCWGRFWRFHAASPGEVEVLMR
jgi:hypothetical protein